ncbi:MAG: STAS domain-containing protein, partial [Archangium sp.]
LSRFEALAFVVTAVSILVGDFVEGVATGLVVALVHFVLQHRQLGLRAKQGAPIGSSLESTIIVEVQGAIFFASADQLDALSEHDPRNALVLDLRRVPLMDLTGASALRSLIETLNAKKARVLLVGSNPEVSSIIKELGVIEMLCGKQIFETIDAALEAAHEAASTSPLRSSPSGITSVLGAA